MQLFLVTCDMCNYIGQVAKDIFSTSGNHKKICQCKNDMKNIVYITLI